MSEPRQRSSVIGQVILVDGTATDAADVSVIAVARIVSLDITAVDVMAADKRDREGFLQYHSH